MIIAAAQARDIGAELTETRKFGFGVRIRRENGFSGCGVVNGNRTRELFVEIAGEWAVAGRVFVTEIVDHGESILANLPITVTAIFPFGQVAGSDGVAFKVFFEDGLDFREGIEPFEDGFTFFAVLKTAIELFTDVMRETSDFSGTHG